MGRICSIQALGAMALLLTACGAPLYKANLAGVRVEILPQSEVQGRCAKLGVGLAPVAAYALLTPTLGCAQRANGRATVYSIDSASVLLHELDHAFNQKWCHTVLGAPDYCTNRETKLSER